MRTCVVTAEDRQHMRHLVKVAIGAGWKPLGDVVMFTANGVTYLGLAMFRPAGGYGGVLH